MLMNKKIISLSNKPETLLQIPGNQLIFVCELNEIVPLCIKLITIIKPVPSAMLPHRNPPFPHSLRGFPPNSSDFRQSERQVKIGVYLELERRGHSIPSGGKLSSKLEANKAAPHKLINQQRQINSDKHTGHTAHSSPLWDWKTMR